MLISRRDSGFTLIEIMVVLVIIAIMTALIAPQIMGRVDEARVTAAKQDIRTLETSLDFYQMDNFRYPTTDQGLSALVEKPDTGAAELAGRVATSRPRPCRRTPGATSTATCSRARRAAPTTCVRSERTASPAVKKPTPTCAAGTSSERLRYGRCTSPHRAAPCAA